MCEGAGRNNKPGTSLQAKTAPVRNDVVALIRTAESFNAELPDVIDRLTNKKTESYRKKLAELIR